MICVMVKVLSESKVVFNVSRGQNNHLPVGGTFSSHCNKKILV